jgi:hypothetical protein
MLRKTSVSMMVLLVASSMIGISSLYQHIEGQTPTPTPRTQQTVYTVHLEGKVLNAIMVVSPSKTCSAFIELPADNLLRLPQGTHITLAAPIESCTLFGLAKIGNTPIKFVIPGPAPTTPPSARDFRVTQVIL